MAQNQIDVWNQVLAINAASYANNNTVLESSIEIDATNYDHCQVITSTQTMTIESEATVTQDFGIGATVMFGGSGVNASAEFSFERSLTSTSVQSSMTSEGLCFYLNDDDGDDVIDVRVEKDPKFGSPIFKYNLPLATSCPYEGGTRRDQPEITADSPQCLDQTNLEVVSIDSIMGDTLAVPINVCSNSNESRTYSLKTGDLIGQLQIVAPGGFVISNTQHVNFTVNANACVLPQIQFIDYNNSPGVHVYENIQLILYPVCAGLAEEVEADTLVFNLTFGGQGAPAYTDSDCDGIPDLNDVCPFVPNIMDNALDFDGVNDRVSVPALNLNSNTVTFEAWVYPDGAQDPNDGIIFCRNGTNTIAGLTIAPSADKFYYKWGGGNTWTGGPLVRENEWQHVALVIEPTKTTIYHNGVPYVHNNITNNPQPFSGLTFLGRDNINNSLQFSGILDEVRIWNTARSQYDIRYNLNKKLTGNEPNLVAYYDFEVGDACENNTGLTTLPDRTGNGHNGTLLDFNLTGNTPQNGCESNWRVGRNFEKNSDSDDYYNSCDNCPYVANNDQADADGDGVGDACDACPGFDDLVDTDSDGAPDGCDPCMNGTGTTLEIGDIAFTGYSADSNDFSFVLLHSIDPCTVVRFTDRGWLPYGFFFEDPNDRTVTFAAGRGFACGEQITITSNPFEALDESGASAGVLSGKPLSLNVNGDQLFAFQGAEDPSLWDQSSFIAAISMNYSSVVGGWSYTTNGSNFSALPEVFTDSVNALAIIPEVDNANFICDSLPATNDATEVFNALMEPDNWYRSNDLTGISYPPLCGFGCCSESLTLANAYTGVTKLFEASDNITSSDMIAGNSDIDYSSGNDIDILPNFSVELGSEFHAFIAGCLLPFPIQAPKSSTALQAPGNSILEVKGVADITPTQKEVGFVLAKKADVQMALLDQAMQPTGIEITMPGLEGGTYTQSVFLDQPGKDYFLQITVDGKVVASKITLK
ncbi:MAG: hypothetical protein H6577_14755 [Lewinellaceae bacterium]|nr:hypothetical protein [Saprospiraceae bacterium]MCB9339387.1 hypothetical protein [Lewinellaceae bacterium]